MEIKNFERAVRDFTEQRPFKPYFVELVSGRIIPIDHPEALITRNGQAAHLAPEGAPSLFDAGSVARVFYAKAEPAAT